MSGTPYIVMGKDDRGNEIFVRLVDSGQSGGPSGSPLYNLGVDVGNAVTPMNLAPSSNTIIPTGYSLAVVGYFYILSGFTLYIQSGAYFAIL